MGRSRGLTKIAKDIDASGNLLASAISPDVTLGGATVYANRSNLPVSGNNEGDQAYVTANNRLYIWNGNGWYSVALLNVAPAISSIQDSDGNTTPFELSTAGVVTTITITAVDSDGDAVTYSATADSDFSGLATLSQDDNVFTVTPLSFDSATTESGTIIFKATDNVNIASSGVQTFTLEFVSALWKDVTLSIGMADSDGLDNSTFIDKSTTALTVTPTGSPTQSSFHPYLDNWSVEFDEASRVNMASPLVSAAVSTFTVECWVYMTEAPTVNASSSPQPSGMVTLEGIPGAATNYNSFGVLPDRTVSLRWFDGSAKAAVTSSTLDISRWYHIACVVNANAIKIYIDGTEDTLTGTTTLTNRNGGTNQSGFGGNYWTDFYGYLSNLRVTHSVVYTQNFTPSTENLANITNTVLLACQSNRLIDNSSSPIAQTITSTPKISAFNPFGQPSEYVPGENKGSTYFGDNAEVDIPHDGTQLDLRDNPFTIECWFYANDYSTSPVLFAQADQVNDTSTVWINNDATIGVQYYVSGTNRVLQYSTTTVKLKHWHHIAIVCDGDANNTGRVYLDGEQILTWTNAYNWGDGSFANDFSIGYNAYAGNRWLDGYIADFRITNGTARYTSNFSVPTTPVGNTSATLYLPFDNAGIYDKTGNNALTLAADTATSNTQTKFADKSISFDGTGDAIVVYDNLDLLNLKSGPFTIEAWYYQTSSSGYATIASMHDPNSNKRAWTICQISTGNMGYYVSSNGTGTSSRNSGSKPLNTWTHIALTRDDSDVVRLFINGTQGGTNLTFASIFDTAGDVPLVIGGQWNSGVYREFPGYIENLQILTGVAKYTSNFTVPTREQGRSFQTED